MNDSAASIYLSVGSNLAPEDNLRLAHRELTRVFGALDCSSVYRNAPVGFDGNDFLNLAVHARTETGPAAVIETLEAIHDLAGRVRGSERFGPRELDIDLLLYGDVISRQWKLPRRDLERYAFVARPMAELAPDLEHPVSGQRMAEIWQTMSGDAPSMQRVALDWPV